MAERPYSAEVTNITDTLLASGGDIIVQPPLPIHDETFYSAVLGGAKQYASIKHITTTDEFTTLRADTKMGDSPERRTAHLQHIARKICELAAEPGFASMPKNPRTTTWRPTNPGRFNGIDGIY